MMNFFTEFGFRFSDLECHRLQTGSDPSSETSGIRIGIDLGCHGLWPDRIGSRMSLIICRIGSRISQITGRFGSVVRDFWDLDRISDVTDYGPDRISGVTDYRPDWIRRPRLPGFGSGSILDVTDYGPDQISDRILDPGSDLGSDSGLDPGSDPGSDPINPRFSIRDLSSVICSPRCVIRDP